MRDHSENKKIPKKCTLFYVSKPRVIIPQENKQNKKKSLKTAKIKKKIFYFQFIFFEIILAKVIQSSWFNLITTNFDNVLESKLYYLVQYSTSTKTHEKELFLFKKLQKMDH